MLTRLGGTGRSLEQRVFAAFESAAGEVFARHAQPDRLANKTLFVRAETAAIAQELTLVRAELLERMAEELGAGLVEDLRTRTGPLTPR